MPASSEPLFPRLRAADYDRYLCTLFAPAAAREPLALLYLFNHELARAAEVASEPIMALIRLTWWREVVEGQRKPHDIATPLARALEAGMFRREDLLELIAARQAEAGPLADAPAFLAHARNTAGRLGRIAARFLGAQGDVVEDCCTAYGIAGMLRNAKAPGPYPKNLLPADGTPEAALVAQARHLLTRQPPRAALAAALPAVLARRDLGKPYQPRGLADRLAVLRAAVMGRV